MELKGLIIEKIENIKIDKIPLTVRYARSKEGDEHCLFVSNDLSRKSIKIQIEDSVAKDLEGQSGVDFQTHLFKIVGDRIKEGLF